MIRKSERISSDGRFPILKQDKHVRKRPEITASGNAGRGFYEVLDVFEMFCKIISRSECVSFSKTACPDFSGSFLRTPIKKQKGKYLYGRKFTVKGCTIAPRPVETV